MDQSETGNPPAQQEGATSLPRLVHGPNGWTGRSKDFRVFENVIRIKESDANPAYVPSEQQRQRTVDEEGNFSQHVELPSNHHLYQLWMDKIGPYLADWVLGKSRNGTSA
jgi:hypothetical protein